MSDFSKAIATLEYNKILSLCAKHAVLDFSKQIIENLTPLSDFEEVSFLLKKICVKIRQILFIFRKKLSGRLLDVISLLPCCILVAHAFGRLGCLFAGCCHGAEVDGFPGIYMETVDVGNGYFIPIHLYEALFLFALFGTCLFLYTKKGFKYNLPTYLISYGVWRFIIEYARADYRGSLVEGITPSQFWSIIMVVAGVGVIFLFKYMFKIHEANKAKVQEKVTVEDGIKD